MISTVESNCKTVKLFTISSCVHYRGISKGFSLSFKESGTFSGLLSASNYILKFNLISLANYKLLANEHVVSQSDCPFFVARGLRMRHQKPMGELTVAASIFYIIYGH